MAEQPKYVTTADGRRITYTRWKYEETQRQQATLAQVNDLITSQATTLANVGANMAQQEYGGYLRTIIPNLLDSYGNVNAQAAINYYEQSRKEWFNAYGSEASRQVTRSSVAAREKRFAAAKTQGAYRVGTMTAEDFAAKFLPTYKTLEKSEAVIGFAMKVRAKSGHEPSVSAMNNALTREVASYHRDTVLFNSALDPFVSRVQRVAQAGACEFCKLMALGSTSGKVRVSSYAVKFHSHCHCTIQTLWEGEDPIRPDYYDDFEQEYIDAAGEGRSAKETLEQWRKNTKAKVVEPTAIAKKLDLANAEEIKSLLSFQRTQGFTAETAIPAQRQALADYVSTNPKILGHRDINGVLRGDLANTYTFSQDNPAQVIEIRDKVAALDNLIESAPSLKEPVLSYRGVNTRFAYAFRNLKPGESFQDLGFTSTSLSDEVAKKFARRGLIVEIENPVGTKGIVVDSFTNDINNKWVNENIVDTVRYGFHNPKVEMEWLLPRNTVFEIVEAEKDGVIKVRVKQ